MNRNIILPIVVILIAGGTYFGWSQLSKVNEPADDGTKIKITVFKSPTCGCCGDYIIYLKQKGYAVKVENKDDMLSIKETYQVPTALESCHTSVVDNYFVEGHVPVEAIEKLLTEKPDILGIALPGMPAGSPGMGGPKNEGFKIQALMKDGSISDFMII